MVNAAPVRSPAVPRSIAILEDIAREGSSAVSDIASRTGISRSSVSDLCTALVLEHLLKRDGGARLVLGRALAQIGTGLTSGVPLAESFAGACDRVDELAGYSVTLDTLYCGEVLCIELRHGRFPLALTPRVGRRTALLGTTTGAALLLGASVDQLSTHVATFGPMFTAPAPTLRALLDERTRLVATSGPVVAGANDGRWSELAAPVRRGDSALGAVTVVSPAGSANHESTERLGAGLLRLAELLEKVDGSGPTSWLRAPRDRRDQDPGDRDRAH